MAANLENRLTKNDVAAIERQYDERCARFGALRDAYQRRSNLNGNANLLLFLLAVAAVGVASLRGDTRLYWPAGALALAFIAGLVHLDGLQRQLRRYRELYNLNSEGKSRLRREWSGLPLQADAGGDRGGTERTMAEPGGHGGTEAPEGLAPAPKTGGTGGGGTAPTIGGTGSRGGTEAPQGLAPAPTDDRTAGGGGTADEGTINAATAADLDLLGYGSLEHLLGTPKTPVGRAALRNWILHPADPGAIRLRQGAAGELGPDIDFRDEACVRARLMGSERTDYHRFLEWAESESQTSKHTAARWYSRAALPLLVLLAGGQLLGLTPYPAITAILIGAVLLANGAFLLAFGRTIGEEIERVATQQNVFEAYASIIGLFTAKTVTSPGLEEIQSRMSAGSGRADEQLRRLARLMPLADFRHWMFFIFIELPTLWSFHTLSLLERWKQANGSAVRGWLAALGEAEALVALAGLHHDHPAWAFPVILEGAADRLTAADLAHPLLPPARAIGNDVTVGPPGTFLLVTGSNMSGKSTLLRAIGVNAVLAQMGGPVCAAALRLPPLAVTSAMRVQDSLEQGISYFMAELQRLKAIVDRADRYGRADRNGRTGNGDHRALLYLLDEILVGTNTAERQAAARHVILHLVRSGAIGAVSTHDLTLAALPEVARVAEPVHFQETFTDGPEGKAMTFDYRLRPGLAVSTNALKLMELVGLPVEE